MEQKNPSLHTLSKILSFLKTSDNCLLLWNGCQDRKNYRSYIFVDPLGVISCQRGSHIWRCFEQIEKALKSGLCVAGFISYEAGLFFEDVFERNNYSPFPFLWFGVYKRPIIYNHLKETFEGLRHLSSERINEHCKLRNGRFNTSKEEYVKNVGAIKDYIAKGQTYQVNYTVKYTFVLHGSPYQMFLALSQKQSVSYAAFIKLEDFYILSLSPELFFRRNREKIITKPMKGTIERGRDFTEDKKKKQQLQSCPKNRAENIMIVDLLRNDLGRVSQTGSVFSPRLFEIEQYETLFQMTSTIKAKLKTGMLWSELFKNIFPSGSVTGAPKIQTMKIIKKLEKEPRRIYTGSIGFILPTQKAVFNVAIRTLLIDRKTKKGEMGIGGGIVFDSDPQTEYKECKLKAEFLTSRYSDFQLIETMVWQHPRGYFLLELHLKRLENSAKYFGFTFDKKYILSFLKRKTLSFEQSKKYRLKLLLDREGKFTIASSLLDKRETPKIAKLIFSKKNTDSSDIFLYHKTTQRQLYDTEYAKWKRKGYFDVIFTNEKGHVTEGAISNLFIKKGRFYYTPPVECGLLDGCYRRYLIRNNRLPIQEKVLYKDDFLGAEGIYVANSVRGMTRAQMKI